MIVFSLLYSARTETRQWEVLSQPSAHRGWIVGDCFNRWVSESSSQVISEWMYSICVFSVYMENTHSVSSNNLILSHLENSNLPNKNRKNFKKGNTFKKGILEDKEDPKRILKTHMLKHTLYISALFLFFFFQCCGFSLGSGVVTQEPQRIWITSPRLHTHWFSKCLTETLLCCWLLPRQWGLGLERLFSDLGGLDGCVYVTVTESRHVDND